MFNGSKITLDSPKKNNTNNSNLTEHIKHNIKLLSDVNWTMAFACSKAHAGDTVNETVDNLAEQTAKSISTPLYSKIPRNAFLATLKQESLGKCQNT